MEKMASSALRTNTPGVPRRYRTLTAPTRHTATVVLDTWMKTPVFLWSTVVFHMTPVQRTVRVVGVQHQSTPIWSTPLTNTALKLIGLYLHRQTPLILMPPAARQLLLGRTAYQWPTGWHYLYQYVTLSLHLSLVLKAKLQAYSSQRDNSDNTVQYMSSKKW